MRIRTYPEAILRKVSEEVPVNEISDYFDLMEAMEKVIIDFNALGLAAVQIGELTRIVGIMSEVTKKPYFMINPKIIQSGGTQIGPEACLSFPNVVVNITRKSYIKVEYYTKTGELKTEELMGKEAIVVQHEIDHLNGVTLYQSAPQAMRGSITRKLKVGRRRLAKYDKFQRRLKKFSEPNTVNK